MIFTQDTCEIKDEEVPVVCLNLYLYSIGITEHALLSL